MSTVPLTNKDLTTGALNGTGTFDILMQSASKHLQEEFRKNRIKGAEYSQVYLGSLNAVMAQATQFLLQRDQASNQALLIEKQVELIEIEKEKLLLEAELVSKQIIKMEQDALLVEAQIKLVDQQLETEEANTKDITTGTIGKAQAKLVTENTNLNKQGSILDSEKLLLDQNRTNAVTQNTALLAEIELTKVRETLTEQQVETEKANTKDINTGTIGKGQSKLAKEVILLDKQEVKLDEDTNLVRENINNAQKQGTVLTNQATKIGDESNLLRQKKVTETAQTNSYNIDTNSVVGRQSALYTAQIKGFQRDAEQKAGKIALDGFAVAVSNELTTDIPDELKTTGINEAIKLLNTGAKDY